MKFPLPFATPLFCVLGCLLITLYACNPSEPEPPTITYPVTYTFDTIKYETGRYFVLTTSGQSEIPMPFGWQIFEGEAFDILDPSDVEIFQKIELQTESLATLWVNPDIFVSDPLTNLPYTTTNGVMTINLDPSVGDPLHFNVNNTDNTLRWGLTSTTYSFRKPNGTLDYGIIETAFEPENDYAKIVQRLRTDRTLQVGDTVAVKLGGVWFKN